MAARDRQNTRGKIAHLSDKLGQAVPAPHDGGPVKHYNQAKLARNGELPSNPYKGIVTRGKPLPGEPDNLA